MSFRYAVSCVSIFTFHFFLAEEKADTRKWWLDKVASI